MTTALELFEENAPVAIRLRDYQEKAVQSVLDAMDRGIQRGLIVLPTGSGKTVLFSALIASLRKNPEFTSLVIAHRKELIDQASRTIRNLNPGMSIGIESGDERAARGSSVVVAGTQSINGAESERLSWLAPSLVIQDEAHRGGADGNQRIYRRMGCFDDGGAFLLGVTATPHRLDNRMLHGSNEAIFQEILFKYSLVEAIKDGWLVDLVGYRVESDTDIGSVKTTAGDYNQRDLENAVNTDPRNELAFKAWAEQAPKSQTIVFCAGVDHAKAVSEVFRAHGVNAESVDGSMRTDERVAVMDRYRSGKTQVLTNMDIATEGFDDLNTSCIILLRPTKSWSLYVQCLGRGLRPLAGLVNDDMTAGERRASIGSSPKPRCVIIDVADLTTSHTAGRAPKQGDIPCLNGVVGLPPKLDLEGRTIGDAVEEFEGLDEMVRAGAFKHAVSFSGLKTKLVQIRMLADIDVPEEADQAGAKYSWLKVDDLKYTLDCGNANDMTKRRAILGGDLLGNWTLALLYVDAKGVLHMDPHEMPEDLDRAFGAAEHQIRKTFWGVENICGRNMKWRSGAATDAQKKLLGNLGCPAELIDTIDKGKASMLIGYLMEQKRNGSK